MEIVKYMVNLLHTMDINLFELSSKSEDRSPNTWLWLSGKGYRNKIEEIIDYILKNRKCNRRNLINQLLNEFTSSIGPIQRTIYGKNDVIPIPILEKLLENSGRKDYYQKYFLNNANKISTSRRKGVNIIKNIDSDLAEILGAFAADGSLTVLVKVYSKNNETLKRIMNKYDLKLKLQKDMGKFFIRTSKIPPSHLENIQKKYKINYSITYLFEIVDADKIAIEYIANKIESIFGIKGNINEKKGAWSLRIYNKILARYFRVIGFNYGRKTETIREPQILKYKRLPMRLAFARGVISFDGSVKYSGEIYMSLKNNGLINDIYDILTLLNINSFVTKKNSMCTIYIDKNNKKSLSIFIPNTKKWHRLNNFLNSFKKRITTIEEARKILYEYFDKYNRKSITFNELIDILINKKQINSNNFENKDTAFYTKLRILEQMNVIKVENTLNRDKYGKITEKFKMYYYNSDLNSWRLPIM